MTSEDIFQAVEKWSGCAISLPLRATLSRINDTSVGDLAYFYALADLLERNQTYETREYCPGWLTIGDDGGGSAIVVTPNKWPTPVFLVGHGSMSRADFVEVAEDLDAWVRSGCKLQTDGHSGSPARTVLRAEDSSAPLRAPA